MTRNNERAAWCYHRRRFPPLWSVEEKETPPWAQRANQFEGWLALKRNQSWLKFHH
jgi:hypothetical protein